MGKKLFLYTISCLGIYFLLAGLEIFVLSPLYDMISFDYRIHVLIYLLLLIVVDPLVTRAICERISFPDRFKEGE